MHAGKTPLIAASAPWPPDAGGRLHISPSQFLQLELDKMDAEQQGKEKGVDQANVDVRIAELRAAAAAGQRQEAVEGLLALEKAGRVAEDITSTRKACTALLEVRSHWLREFGV